MWYPQGALGSGEEKERELNDFLLFPSSAVVLSGLHLIERNLFFRNISMFVYIQHSFPFCTVWPKSDSSADSEPQGGTGGRLQIPEMWLQGLSPFATPPPDPRLHATGKYISSSLWSIIPSSQSYSPLICWPVYTEIAFLCRALWTDMTFMLLNILVKCNLRWGFHKMGFEPVVEEK